MTHAIHDSGTRRSFHSARLRSLPAVLGAIGLLGLGCSSGDDGGEPGPAGGSGGLGGAATAGDTSSGGTPASGGATTGGASSGGATTGGVSSGGATGGATTGGASTGGSVTAGSGGAAVAGGPSGGAPSAGAGAGGGGGGGAMSSGSPGCGSATPLKSGEFTENIDGTMRKYVIDVPSGYETNKKYRLVFVWHPLTGSASQVVSGGYNGLKSLSEGSAIFVAGDGLMGGNGEASGRGWWNENDGDMKLLTAILAKLKAGLCIDNERIFSTGFSFGGMMSYAVGYEFKEFRAIAPCSGDLQVIRPDENNTAPLPIMAFHGDKDDFVTTARGRAARDKYIARNKCMATTMPASPSPCVEYQGCSAPTFWCEFSGGHNTWSEQPKAIWKFFSQF